MALTLTKTGIINGSTIQVGHVTQSIDAFNGTAAYDITLSGSLTLTGSVTSYNGFTGSFSGSLTGDATSLKSNIYLLGSSAGIQNLKMIAGTAKLTAGSVSFLVSELSTKTLGSNCFITATLSGSAAANVAIGGLTAGNLTFNGSGGSNDMVYFQAVYF
jgi:hypothetical protein